MMMMMMISPEPRTVQECGKNKSGCRPVACQSDEYATSEYLRALSLTT
jgi:hypothetical protein